MEIKEKKELDDLLEDIESDISQARYQVSEALEAITSLLKDLEYAKALIAEAQGRIETLRRLLALL